MSINKFLCVCVTLVLVGAFSSLEVKAACMQDGPCYSDGECCSGKCEYVGCLYLVGGCCV